MESMLRAALTLCLAQRALSFAPSRAAGARVAPRPSRPAVSMEMGVFEMVAPAIGTAAFAALKPWQLFGDDAAAPIDDKKEVEGYFNDASSGGGFDRWNRIYSQSDDVNDVQLDIRNGHQQTIDKVLEWVDDDAKTGAPALSTVADVGCGVGSLSIPLAKRGATIAGSDISAAMAAEAAKRCAAAVPDAQAAFATADLESLDGAHDTVACIDVMIHYPSDKMVQMVTHLASKADRRLLISFAPKTPYYSFLKKVGGLFPGPSKTTRAYLHPEDDVRAALKSEGFEIKREHLTATNFYFSRLFEAVRV